MDFANFFKFFTAICLAWWFRKEISYFSEKINQQIYTEFNDLVNVTFSYSEFKQRSMLQPKNSKYTLLFYLIFPFILFSTNEYPIGIILIILYFLAVLDCLYYLTDVKYISVIFLLTLPYGNIESLYGTVFFFIFIHLVSMWILKKEGFGLGDSFLLSAVSPLFTLEQMLHLILIASLLGISYYLIESNITQQKRQKLPFIPFISLATLIIISLNRS